LRRERGSELSEKGPRAIQAHRRALIQAAKLAIIDVNDAIVELVTNSDDRYQILKAKGSIDIEVVRRRGDSQQILKVKDYADGMDAKTMESKLSFIGGRDSGLDRGEKVRGTHSRGAKDVAAIGRVVFESIAGDGRYHKCEITPYLDFVPHESKDVTPKIRKSIGISKGTGMLVTIELDKYQRVPQHDNLKRQIQRLVSLRSILGDDHRTVTLADLGQARRDRIVAPRIRGKERVKDSFTIPGYPQATAKIVICRAKERFDREYERFRLGGILVESKRAVHQATLFDSGLESDTHALCFYGKLVCHYIDDLCNEFDERFESRRPFSAHNPTYPLDPSRRSGLNREHPFVQALFAEALRRLRPLVEEERKREERERDRIESKATRKRLNALEKAAHEFMHDFSQEEEEEIAREPDGKHPESRFLEKGYVLSPPFTQMIVGHSRLFWINIRQETFPELEIGSTLQIECMSSEITTDKRYCGLEPHPNQAGVLRALWKVKAVYATSATGVRVRVGPITAESAIEVLASEADRYRDVVVLQFSKKRYRMRTDQKHKRIRILAPMSPVPVAVSLNVEVDSNHFDLSGQQVLRPNERLHVALCDLSTKCDGQEASAMMSASLGEAKATADIASVRPLGAELSIKLEDIDLGNQRYRWRQNVLEIAARHPSLRRYLGEKQQGFPGQESKHFRLVIAEVVADAVCALLVRRNVQASPEEFEDADWDAYYALYSKYMTQFLPTAHKLQCPDG